MKSNYNTVYFSTSVYMPACERTVNTYALNFHWDMKAL